MSMLRDFSAKSNEANGDGRHPLYPWPTVEPYRAQVTSRIDRVLEKQ